MMEKVMYIDHDIFLMHDTGSHPENPERLRMVREAAGSESVADAIVRKAPRAAAVEDIGRVHHAEYVEHVRAVAQSGHRYLDSMDTVVSEKSYEAALYAAGAGLVAADEVLGGATRRAFCAVRPPGHHAEADQAMGFCLFNNIAIAAKYIQQKHNLERILILDWDVHHGNGTQNAFYADDTVYYISLHEYPHYPGTGAADETGSGRGKGKTQNYPMGSGSADAQYFDRFGRIQKIILDFRPEILLISAGFDAHRFDPLSGIMLSSKAYGAFTEMLLAVADSADGRIISFLEGGYNMKALKESVLYHLLALAEKPYE